MQDRAESVQFDSTALVPAAWQATRPAPGAFVFNPALAAFGDGYLMVYRVVAPRYASQRLAACRLNRDLELIPNSATPLSDTIPGTAPHLADPRLFWYEAQLYMLYSDFRTVDQLWLVAIDPATLAAAGQPRPLLLTPRQPVEKNWMPFAHEGRLFAIYSISPHVVLELDLRQADHIACMRRYSVPWETGAFTRRFGSPRGGAPPVRTGDHYHVFFHASTYQGFVHKTLRRLKQWLLPPGRPGARRPTSNPGAAPPSGLMAAYIQHFIRLRYVGGYYAFAAEPPFAPVLAPRAPVLVPEREAPPQRADRLRPVARQVVFPTGAVAGAGETWLLAYGVHDERCVLRVVGHDALRRACRGSG